ncbi:hypothetical protein EDD29_0165 [Actinocorallia herbida]|uniref:Uncharacterized protein n=1 Tax=Actinocorallia herbida TaxID=58109 RepID=A0A3N1CN23_9ACTN|nr:hypothetical protein [Actinocorallia herbida]ROO82683.1 hypothetical protein EDD29_0165 [Actinocorallia herbida]
MFFEHEAPTQGEPYMRNTTRYLCAAAYLDEDFRNRVIAEYVEDEHRAVAPGGGYDLAAVVKHCLHARRLVLYRDVVFVVAFVLGLLLNGWAALMAAGTLLWMAVLLRVRRWLLAKNRRWLARYVGFTAMVGPLFQVFSTVSGLLALQAEMALSQAYLDPSATEPDIPSILYLMVVLFAAFLVVAVAIECGYLVFVYRLMQRTLHPLSDVEAPASPSPHTARLLDRLAAAQHGNVSVYSVHPFLGSGRIRKQWAIVLELDRTTGAGEARVDPARLQARVWQRISEMKVPDPGDPGSLPKHESIVGLDRPQMHVVAHGRLAQYSRPLGLNGQVVSGHPLVDSGGAPYSHASAEAVDAILHHPQGALRCYQRISVDSRGQLVSGKDGAAVAPAEDQDVATTAFLHVAVEGRMLYAQFIATALTPVRREFKIVDELPSVAGQSLVWMALRRRWDAFPSAAVFAPLRIVRTLAHMGFAALRAGTAQPQRLTVHDYGFRISPRELAASAGYDTYVQLLDTDKYIRLIERRVNEAILDHLSDECGVDVSAYREQMTAITNSSVTITGSTITGSQINTGAGATQVRQTTS